MAKDRNRPKMNKTAARVLAVLSIVVSIAFACYVVVLVTTGGDPWQIALGAAFAVAYAAMFLSLRRNQLRTLR